MRHLSWAVVIFAFASMTTDAEAQYQYPQSVAPGSRTYYRPVYPARPIYRQQYLPVAPRYIRPTNPTGYQNRPYYGAYGYGIYSNGSTDGFPPFRGRGWR